MSAQSSAGRGMQQTRVPLHAEARCVSCGRPIPVDQAIDAIVVLLDDGEIDVVLASEMKEQTCLSASERHVAGGQFR